MTLALGHLYRGLARRGHVLAAILYRIMAWLVLPRVAVEEPRKITITRRARQRAGTSR
jgi:hypothetical protein